MLELDEIRKEIKSLQNDVGKNYDKLLNIYLRLMIEYKYLERTDEDL
tara:strand:+ start:804 stop:944 length:141 start_codon:yes stop_codon:yes gene_type:complete